MMTAVRSALSSGSFFFRSGNKQLSESLFKSAIKSAIRDRKMTRMPANLVETLENGLQASGGCNNKDDSVWHLRQALDLVYDEYVDMYCGVKDARFSPVHKIISNVISLATAIQGKNSADHLKQLYLKCMKGILEHERLSDESKEIVKKALQLENSEIDTKTQLFTLRKALDYVYDEVRLPEVFQKTTSNLSTASITEKDAVLIDFTSTTQPGIKLTPKVLNDTVMGGKSTSTFNIEDEEGLFEGNIFTVNDGGFASVKFHPENVDKFKEMLKDCVGVVVTVKNLEDKVQRFKVQLASMTKMRAFNYQSEVILPPKSEYTPVFLHISTFWPTMFGHILAHQGKVDVTAIDTVGLIVSKLKDDGKPNPDFNEGRFSLAIKSIKIKY